MAGPLVLSAPGLTSSRSLAAATLLTATPLLTDIQEILHFSVAARLDDHPMNTEVRGCGAFLSFLF